MSAEFRKSLGARFIFLSDQEGELLDRLNIRHKKGYLGKDIAFPTAVLVDRYGIVRWTYEMAYGNVRMRPAELFEAIERMTLEEQNRELLRGRAVSQVVKQVFLMHRSVDLAKVIQLVRKELQRLGFRFSFCGIIIFDKDKSVSRTYLASAVGPTDENGNETAGLQQGSPSLPYVELPLSGVKELEDIVVSWEKGKVYSRNYEAGESSEYWDELKKTSTEFKTSQVTKGVVHAPFTHGMLSLGREGPDPFTEDEIQTMSEFAGAFSVGYRRFLDFRELERRNRKLQETQLQLVQTEKMASLGELVAGIAHELNTPMGAIKSNAQITARAVTKLNEGLGVLSDSDEGGREKMVQLLDQLDTLNRVNLGAAERVIKIVDSLRSFARLDEAEWKSADLHQGLNDTLTLIRSRLGERIKLTKRYGSLPEVVCFPKKMNQVFMILLSNATQAIKEEGHITIETTMEGDRAVIRISDTGVGIPPEHIQRVFDPGFTTKGVGVGTGLGLSICYQIMDEHQGNINVVSKLGEGSTFTIEIPIKNEGRFGSQTVANLEEGSRN